MSVRCDAPPPRTPPLAVLRLRQYRSKANLVGGIKRNIEGFAGVLLKQKSTWKGQAKLAAIY